MWVRIIAGIAALGLAANGLDMLFQPLAWYHSLDSVVHTGPFNAHFVSDIGAAYLASAVGIALGIWRADWLIPAGGVAMVFLGVHAGLHGVEWGSGHAAATHAGWVDYLGVYSPPVLLALWMFAGSRGKYHV